MSLTHAPGPLAGQPGHTNYAIAGPQHRLLATPLPRTAIVLGKAAGACVRALVQALLLLVVIAIAGIGVRWSVDGVLGTLVMLMLGTAAFACMSSN